MPLLRLAIISSLLLIISTLSPAAADDDYTRVTCGSVIKLKHTATGMRLHSHKVNYGTGSGQQSVTGNSDVADPAGLWLVKPAHGGERCPQGKVLRDGDKIRLEHVNTGKYLHSHLHQSPLSGQQEVSCYLGNDGRGDTGDNWRLEVPSGGAWTRGEPVRLVHVDTNKYLNSHNHKFGSPIAGQTEVTCIDRKSQNTVWQAEEGVYFPAK